MRVRVWYAAPHSSALCALTLSLCLSFPSPQPHRRASSHGRWQRQR